MDDKDSEFFLRLLSTFKIEALEHLQNLTNDLIRLEKEKDIGSQKEFLEGVFREAHSLKGAARAVNLNEIQAICQALENVLSAIKHQSITLSKTLFETLFKTIDHLNKIIENIDSQNEIQESSKELDDLTSKLEQLLLDKSEKPAEAVPPEAAKSVPPTPKINPPAPKSKEALSSSDAKQKTIRVSTPKLDHLLLQTEEMLIVKLSSKQRSTEVKEVEAYVEGAKDISPLQAEIRLLQQLVMSNKISDAIQQMHTVIAKTTDFLSWYDQFAKSLKKDLGHISSAISRDIRVFGTIIDNLLDDVKNVLLQPFSTILEPFPRMVRDIAAELNKDVTLHIQEKEVELDRRILEELKNPLIHLLRNSIDHGIETAEERAKASKKLPAVISIRVIRTSGNKVEIIIKDDGRGIDVEKVKKSALKLNLISPQDLKSLNTNDALNLIFHSGVSTSQIITDLSGRGLGMGIVLEKVEKLGGSVHVNTKLGAGTTVKITIPETLAAFRGVYVKVSDQIFIIPTLNVQRVLRVPYHEIKTVEMRQTIVAEGQTISLVNLNEILNLPKKEILEETITVIVISALQTTLAFRVDAILSEEETFVKNLGKQLEHAQNISSATVIESGEVIPILDPFELVKSVLKRAYFAIHQELHAEKQIKKIILIAEDAITARILLKNILESAGFEVKTAVDGAEAFAILQKEPVDLLVSDVDMPHLNGFDLTAKIRADEKLASLPVVLCTSLGSREDREHGIKVGANAYIDKSAFAQSNLIDIVQKLL